jgi:hypothetical protein
MLIETFLPFGMEPWMIMAIGLWSLPWKGYALWKAARGRNNFWFIALLLINTVGILDILYIFVFSRIHKNK